MRATSVKHAEYDILYTMLYGESPEGRNLEETLVSLRNGRVDKVASKRTKNALSNIQKVLTTMLLKRQHKLPDNHLCDGMIEEDFEEQLVVTYIGVFE